MTRDHIVNYIQANYVAPRMVVVAAGNVDHDAFTAQVAKAFAATPETPSGPSVISSQSPAWFTGSDIRVRDDDVRTMRPSATISSPSLLCYSRLRSRFSELPGAVGAPILHVCIRV